MTKDKKGITKRRAKALYDYAYSKYPDNSECAKAFLEGFAKACELLEKKVRRGD